LFLPGAGWDDHGACENLARLKQTDSLFVVPLLCDIIPLKLPQFCNPLLPPLFVPWLRSLLALSDLVLAISQHTRRDLLACGPELPPIEVIRLGDELTTADPPVRPPALADGVEDFVLSVGTLEPRKNHWLLYHLWRRLAEELGERLPALLLAGRPGWNTGDLLDQLRRDPLVRGRILLLEDIGDRELLWLYRHCRFTLYPSHYEGWGLPVAESLAHGKVCICSDISSLPEIAPGLVEHHDPLDLPECARLVRRALLEPDFLRRREAHIRAGFRPTPWRECAAHLLALVCTNLGVQCGTSPTSFPPRRKAI
jgi:glycosyltransferase involved in cell wall biosynthesis